MTPGDADIVARLHARSWQSAYRGIFDDRFLDGPVVSERLAAWRGRMSQAPDAEFGFLALADGEPAGFIRLQVAADPAWGTLLDNLHVLPAHRSAGVGRQLIAAGMRECVARQRQGDGVWLWVYDANMGARQVYAHLGGREVEQREEVAADGRRLAKWRVAWASANALLARVSEPARGRLGLADPV